MELDAYLIQLGQSAKQAARSLRKTTTKQKNAALEAMANALLDHKESILAANAQDIKLGKDAGLTDALLERLTLTDERIQAMASDLRKIAQLPDPLTVSHKQWVNADGLNILQKAVPLGVIGIIYESRPNVTVDATALCLKAGNAVILRGGKEALQSNIVLVNILRTALQATAIYPDAVQLINDPSRELASQFMQMNDYVDCLIPRGGAGLIQTVVKQATVPVIETGVGNCHLYVHEKADMIKAEKILVNGKVQRNSVCNALETLLIDASIASSALPKLLHALASYGVEIRGDQATQAIWPESTLATDLDYATEFLDSIISVKVVSDYQEAIDHIERFSTGHSEAIVTEDYSVSQAFLMDIDAAAVYVNASTRYTDGGQFGFGGEIGVSTQKLHARGPMGLEALVSYKYVIQGNGQIRQ